MQSEKPPKDFKDSYMLARAWSIGGGIVFLSFLGYYLDQRFQTDHLYVLIGFGIGIVYTVYEIYKTIKSEK